MSDERDWLGNPAARAATEARVLARSCESLIGICAGLMADRVLNEDEIRFLDIWLRDHEELCNTWPGDVIRAKVSEVMSDGIITEEEKVHLADVLSSLLGGTIEDGGSADAGPTALPVNADAAVAIPGRSFCFTGDFLYGTRAACERAVKNRQGIVRPAVTLQLDYLVIGAMVSKEWAHSSFGRKIEKAVVYQGRGAQILIVSEPQWVSALGEGRVE